MSTEISPIVRNRFPLVVQSVVDGDTILATVRLPWKVDLRDRYIRCSNYDAWEKSAVRQGIERVPGEVDKGKAARNALANLLNRGKVFIEVDLKEFDNFGRMLGKLYVVVGEETICVATFMTKNGHCRTAP